MATVGTTAILVITGTRENPVTFELHADADNSDTINYSSLDPNVVENIGELVAGQSIIVNNFVGSLWIKGETTGLTYGIPFQIYGPGSSIFK